MRWHYKIDAPRQGIEPGSSWHAEVLTIILPRNLEKLLQHGAKLRSGQWRVLEEKRKLHLELCSATLLCIMCLNYISRDTIFIYFHFLYLRLLRFILIGWALEAHTSPFFPITVTKGDRNQSVCVCIYTDIRAGVMSPQCSSYSSMGGTSDIHCLTKNIIRCR